MVGPAAKREAVAYLRTLFEMSERRVTTLVGADRTMIRYTARRPDDAVLRARLRDLAHQRHRFGYRQLHVLLRREGEAASRNLVLEGDEDAIKTLDESETTCIREAQSLR